MKNRVYLSSGFAAWLLFGCGSIPNADFKGAQDTAADQTLKEQTDQSLYLDDVLDSAGEPAKSTTSIDPSVKDDTKGEHLGKMAENLFKTLDTDQSGRLSLEEFLIGPKQRAAKRQCNEEIANKMETKMTEDFQKNAGDDTQLSLDELKALLVEAGPRVGKHRSEKHPNGQGLRRQKAFSEIVDQFDIDKDGKLSQVEFESWQASAPGPKGPLPGHRHP